MDYPSDPKRRRVHAPNSTLGDVAPHTLDGINAVLEEHSRQIEALVAANKVLEGRNASLEERCEALDRKSESLERACGELEARCSSLERSVQVLEKDVNWTYSAPDIPRSHWIEQGHDEEYADFMEDIGALIKHDAERIRNGEENFICDCLDLDYEDNMAILHDDALSPHFKELADAIQVSSGIQQINMENIELHPSALGILFPAMEGIVTNIDMRRMRFPAEDVGECYEIIVSSIRRNTKLERLVWVNNRIPSVEQADLLIESVIRNRSIKNVRLDRCFNQSEVNGCRALASLMCGRPLRRIDFSDNSLSGVDDVAAALATNPQLELLWIRENELNDRDAELIAEALKQNTNLQQLHLGGGNMTTAGFEKIRAAIYDSSTLNAMESCNHSCLVDCAENDPGCMVGNDGDLTPLLRRRHKLYNLMSVRHAEGSNARHLNAELGGGPIGVKLVPRVLECIEKCSVDGLIDSPVPLSLYFELMRSWKMPELYGHRKTFEGN